MHTSTVQASTTQLPSTVQASNAQDNEFTVPVFVDMLNGIPAASLLPVLSELFSDCVLSLFKCAVPKDFLYLAASAMSQLSIGGRTNVLYNLAKGMGTLRPGSKDSRFPINRMPMGLVEYTAQFFAFDNLQQVIRRDLVNSIFQCPFCRFLVPWIIVFGHRLCTVTLEKNG